MVFQKLLSSLKEKQGKLGCQEAHILWRMFSDRCIIVDYMLELKDRTRDDDFASFLENYVSDYTKEIDQLENRLEELSIAAPERAEADAGDREAAQVLYGLNKLDLQLMLVSQKHVYVNESVRGLLADFTKASVVRTEKLLKHLKDRRWIDEPPLYPRVRPGVNEKVSASEIYLLWDYLMSRHYSLGLIGVFLGSVSDPELKDLLAEVTKVLEKHVIRLEENLLHFGVRVPKGYPESEPALESDEITTDDFIFFAVLRGMQNAVAIDGTALYEAVVNSRLRSLFKNLIFEEIHLADRMIRYGRLKGWMPAPPAYTAGARG